MYDYPLHVSERTPSLRGSVVCSVTQWVDAGLEAWLRVLWLLVLWSFQKRLSIATIASTCMEAAGLQSTLNQFQLRGGCPCTASPASIPPVPQGLSSISQQSWMFRDRSTWRISPNELGSGVDRGITVEKLMNSFENVHWMPCPLCASTVLSAGRTKKNRTRTLSPRNFHTGRMKMDVGGKTYKSRVTRYSRVTWWGVTVGNWW